MSIILALDNQKFNGNHAKISYTRSIFSWTTACIHTIHGAGTDRTESFENRIAHMADIIPDSLLVSQPQSFCQRRQHDDEPGKVRHGLDDRGKSADMGGVMKTTNGSESQGSKREEGRSRLRYLSCQCSSLKGGS